MTKITNSKQRGAIEYTNFLVSVIGISNFYLFDPISRSGGAWVLVVYLKLYQNTY
jgi:hypothetical protein